MKVIKILTSVFFASLLSLGIVQAQHKNKPKIAVVLSGGGAKGIAHIPLLQALDSLNIVPDLIVGTSMGSLVGGFYTMGYSGDSIKKITQNAKWDQLLGGKTSLSDVTVEEKSEFGKYLLDFDIKDKKIKSKVAILNDQYLREFFMTYTNPVYNVSNFDELPIPYRAVATDIVNGKEVVLKSGSLALAMRASMSIPSIFQPVPYGDVLLVDGGILNNFPVDIAKKWGADIIIGSDVSGGMQSKEELEGITPILFQAAMLVSNMKNPESRAMCDILVDHYPHLTYSTGDFQDHEAIYKEGLIATKLQLNELVKLSEIIKKYPQKKPLIPYKNQKIIFDSIYFKGVSNSNLDLIKSRSNIKAKQAYTVDEIVKGIDRSMGTTLFSQIDAKPVTKDNFMNLEFIAKENSNHRLRTSLHYDDYRGVGLILNYTGRNFLGTSSRLVTTIDFGKQPRFRIQYQKQFGKNKSWWWRNEIFGEFLNQKIYRLGDYTEDLNFDFIQFKNEINKNVVSLKSYVGIGMNYENFLLKPRVNTEINDNVFSFEKYRFQNLSVDIHFVNNNLSKLFFAKEGSLFKSKVLRSIDHKLNYQSSGGGISLEDRKTSDFTKLLLSYQKRMRFHKNLTLILGSSVHFIFQDQLKSNQVPFDTYGLGAHYYLGGYLNGTRENSLRFPGLNENDVPVTQAIKFHLKLQTNPFHNVYISPHLNYATIGFGNFNEYIKKAVLPTGNWTESFEPSSLLSVGTTFSYDSILGPANLDISLVNDTNKVRAFLGVGLFLMLSD
ncbi:patatin-like phospholipase family protein [Kordia sp.]|uniref:patatin-like phospholipase family protein n=1 Tax=Kordia sp. TaxID=1965332 RepID=UPI0025B8D7F3|nr:patatin-like phospholipase family protein [Kordia sp.]MCH2195855.1 patatin-like phospholipase family protein [Kordia sp.]